MSESFELTPAELVVLRTALHLLRERAAAGEAATLLRYCDGLLEDLTDAQWVEVGR